MSRPVVQGTANVVREDGTVNSGDDNEEELLCRLLTERIDFQNRIMEQQRTIAELRQVIQDHSRNTPDGGAVENGHAVRFCLHCMKSFSPEEEMASSTKVGSSVRHMDDEEEDTENKTSDCTANGETATVAELVKKVQTLQGWNEELIKTVEELRLALVENDTNAKTNSVYLLHDNEQLEEQVMQLSIENDGLKKRIADDVLKQRLTTRVEVAQEKMRSAINVRRAGRRRLETLESQMMELNDDLYFRQRCDAAVFPRRDVTLVLLFVNGVEYPLSDSVEEFVMNVYQQVTLAVCQQYKGFRVLSKCGLDVFVFQDPLMALQFSKNCEEQLIKLEWPQRAQMNPLFRSVEYDETNGRALNPVEDASQSTSTSYGGLLLTHGKVTGPKKKPLYRGPRIHCCLYACTPEVEVNPSTGRTFLYGKEVQSAISVLLRYAAVGEIIVNEAWIQLVQNQQRFKNFASESEDVKKEKADVSSGQGKADEKNANRKYADILRKILSAEDWEVLVVPAEWNTIKAVLLPASLKERRVVPHQYLLPCKKYLHQMLPPVKHVIQYFSKVLKGSLLDPQQLYHYHTNASNSTTLMSTSQFSKSQTSQSGRKRVAKFVELTDEEKKQQQALVDEHATKLLDYFKMKQEKESVMEFYKKVELNCAELEKQIMSSEDRFVASKRRPLNPSETAYVCTIDTGDDRMWKSILFSNLSTQEYENIRSGIRLFINHSAKQYYGFYMNGNQLDIFTYVFREVEQALAFVSDIYINVNRTGTKYSKSKEELFLFRGGISSGPMASIYRNTDHHGMLKCTGPVIRLSATLCDLARNGEILAMEDVISVFHGKNENLLDQQYNIVKQGGHFLNVSDTMAVVHSILPRPFAYRRTKMMADSLVQQKQKQNHQAMKSGVDVDKEEGADGVTARSTKAILFSREIQYERKVVEEMLNTQLRRMERAEAAAMLAEDAFVLHEKKGSGTAPPTSDAPGEEEGTLLTLTESPTNPFAELKNPYMFTTQLEEFYKKTANYSDSDSDSDGEKLAEDTQANKVRKTLCFMYCDVVGSASLVRELRNFMKDIREKRKAAHSLNDSLAGSDEEEEEDEDFITTRILTSVYEHYNYIAQSILHRHNGYVCATHGGTGYAVAFRSCKDALEAASNLLQAVNSESWPRCLRSLESSLYVKEILKQRLPQSDGAEGHRVDQKTGEHYTVLFNGPRPQISVHRSNQYTWNVIPPVKPKKGEKAAKSSKLAYTTIHVTGAALEEVHFLGKHTHGGELRLTSAFASAAATDAACRELYDLLAKELILSAPKEKGDGKTNPLPWEKSAGRLGHISPFPIANVSLGRFGSVDGETSDKSNSRPSSRESSFLRLSPSDPKRFLSGQANPSQAPVDRNYILENSIVAAPISLEARLDVLLDPSLRTQTITRRKVLTADDDDEGGVASGKESVKVSSEKLVSSAIDGIEEQAGGKGDRARRTPQRRPASGRANSSSLRVPPAIYTSGTDAKKQRIVSCWCVTREAALRALPVARKHDFEKEHTEEGVNSTILLSGEPPLPLVKSKVDPSNTPVSVQLLLNLSHRLYDLVPTITESEALSGQSGAAPAGNKENGKEDQGSTPVNRALSQKQFVFAMKGILASVQSSLQYVLDVKKKEEEEARALQKGENNALEEMSEMNTSKTSLGRSTTSGKSSGPSSIAKVPMPPPLPLMPVGSSGSAARGASPNISVSRLSVGVHQPNATTKGGKAAESNARKKAKAPKGKRLVFEKENTYASALALLYQKNRQWLQTAGQFQGGTIKVKSLLKSANTVTTTTAATQTDPLENKKRSSRSHSSLQNAPGSPYHGASRATSPDGLPPMHKRPSTAGRGSVLSPGAKRGSSSASQLMGTGSPLRRSMVESKGRGSIPSGRPKKNSSSTSETKLQTILYTPPSHELPDDNTSGGEARPTKITFPSFLNNPNLHGGARSNSNSDSNPAGIATSPNEEGIAQP